MYICIAEHVKTFDLCNAPTGGVSIVDYIWGGGGGHVLS